jgi:hypothetical protein
MTIADLTDKQLIRLAGRLNGRVRRWAQGDPFGWDWPTLWACDPGLAGDYRAVIAEARKRQLHKPESERISHA